MAIEKSVIDLVIAVLRDNGYDVHEAGCINNTYESGVFGIIRTNGGTEINLRLTENIVPCDAAADDAAVDAEYNRRTNYGAF